MFLQRPVELPSLVFDLDDQATTRQKKNNQDLFDSYEDISIGNVSFDATVHPIDLNEWSHGYICIPKRLANKIISIMDNRCMSIVVFFIGKTCM
jgi:hypothetical protein